MEYQTMGVGAADGHCEHKGRGPDDRGASARGQAQELVRAETREGYVEEGMLLKDASQDLDAGSIENWITSQVMQTLAKTQAPLPDVVFVNRKDGQAPMAAFDHQRWVIEMGRVDYSNQDQITQLLSTAYHEAVHVEQWFLGLQAYAGLHPGMTAAEVAAKEGIELAVVRLAYARPLVDDAVAEKWFDALFGEASVKRRDTLEQKQLAKQRVRSIQTQLQDVRRSQATVAERGAAVEVLSNELAVAHEKYRNAYDEYRELPEEKEAHAEGDSTGNSIRAMDTQ